MSAGWIAVPGTGLQRLWLRLATLGAPVETICREEGADAEDVLLGMQRRAPAKARRRIWLWLRQEKRLTFGKIAEIFEVDSATVREACGKAERERVSESGQRLRASDPPEHISESVAAAIGQLVVETGKR